MTRFERPPERRINPGLGGLGALLLAICLMTDHPAIADAAASDWTTVAQVRWAAPVPASLAPGNESAIFTHSNATHGQSTRSSMADVPHAALGTALAALWLMGGAWVGIRSARISTSLNQSADQMRNARRGRLI